MAECGSYPRCQEVIDWATSAAEPVPGERPKRMPVNRASKGDPAGNVAVWRDDLGILRFRVLRKGEDPAPGHHRAVSHYATCVDAAAYRRRS